MDATSRASLWGQFGATIDMLENAIRACPDALWNARDTQAKPTTTVDVKKHSTVIKIPADFDTTLKALLQTPPPPPGDPSTRKQKKKKGTGKKKR